MTIHLPFAVVIRNRTSLFNPCTLGAKEPVNHVSLVCRMEIDHPEESCAATRRMRKLYNTSPEDRIETVGGYSLCQGNLNNVLTSIYALLSNLLHGEASLARNQ